ncbi:Gfo/Idh/MocA family oxidoreductase [Sutcliffiella horikoshii]|uniref:Gfo/Idh/MocA family oxidoreductase n=1 Tax=Sutcliffiella horikoshii TaxID=79883 RepID=A0A5D4SH19_9BACI|nr:Gfo/Idh/MocA family oxidoreductase [Sutcliffiella horikoshii]TYS62559.1 Gfo/Idh/MocA family oxidoreductase [Sutcliffiella horikoshii]
MKKIYKVGIVGLGVVGQRLISSFQNNDNIQIAAVCDNNENLAKETAIKCGNISYFSDYKELIQLKEIDFVYVAVPPAVHYDVVMFAFQHNKHVLCEKPLANSEEEAEAMVHAAEESGLVHAMHFPLVYEKAFATIEDHIRKGSFGKIKRITLKMHFDQWPRPWQQTNWIGSRKQGGFIREISPHYLQMILHFFGSVKEVKSYVDYPSNPELSEQAVIGMLELESGVRVLIDGLAGQAENEEIAFIIHGEKQSLTLLNWREVKLANKGEIWKDIKDSELLSSKGSLVEHFVSRLNNEQAFLVGFKEGLQVQRVLEQLIR